MKIKTNTQAAQALAAVKQYHLENINIAITAAGSPEKLSVKIGLSQSAVRRAIDRGTLTGLRKLSIKILT